MTDYSSRRQDVNNWHTKGIRYSMFNLRGRFSGLNDGC